MVIDGATAFCGGINISDEYINEKMRFGHWKDTGFMQMCIRDRSTSMQMML